MNVNVGENKIYPNFTFNFEAWDTIGKNDYLMMDLELYITTESTERR